MAWIGAPASFRASTGGGAGTAPPVSFKWRLTIGILAALRAVLIPGEAGAAMSWSPRLPALDLSPASPAQAEGALAFATGQAGTAATP